VVIQVTLTVFRIVMLVFMIATVAVADYAADGEFSNLSGRDRSGLLLSFVTV
jgi:hypothetical protein